MFAFTPCADVLGFIEVFGQRIEPHDAILVALLVLLEGVLSIDNALVLGLLAKRLPKQLQAKALTYGLIGAFVFRFIAIGLAAYLLYWRIVKLLGGGYLVYVALKHFFWEHHEDHPEELVAVGSDGHPVLVSEPTGEALSPARERQEIQERAPIPMPDRTMDPIPQTTARRTGFWHTVGVIELTDIAFAVDSILAAIALVGSAPAGHPHTAFHPKMWVIVTGGMLGVILMRFAAVVFIRLLERFPRFETSAYLLVIVIGSKLLVDWGFNSPEHPHRVDFHSYHAPAFWIFWGLMLACLLVGFIPHKKASR